MKNSSREIQLTSSSHKLTSRIELGRKDSLTYKLGNGWIETERIEPTAHF